MLSHGLLVDGWGTPGDLEDFPACTRAAFGAWQVTNSKKGAMLCNTFALWLWKWNSSNQHRVKNKRDGKKIRSGYPHKRNETKLGPCSKAKE